MLEPDMPLPPQPVLTRWGTWLEAATYYADNFVRIKKIVDVLEDDASCVVFAKELIQDEAVQAQLAYIKINFGFLVDPKKQIFEDLQKIGASIAEVFPVLKNVQQNLEKAKGPIAKEVLKKFSAVFNANTGLKTIEQINSVMNGDLDSKLPENIIVSNVESFKWAPPLVSAEVETSFSSLKALLRDNRRRLLPDNFKKVLVVQ